MVGPPEDISAREYSIYSGIKDPYIVILVKEFPQGDISPKLAKLKPVEHLRVEGL